MHIFNACVFLACVFFKGIQFMVIYCLRCGASVMTSFIFPVEMECLSVCWLPVSACEQWTEHWDQEEGNEPPWDGECAALTCLCNSSTETNREQLDKEASLLFTHSTHYSVRTKSTILTLANKIFHFTVIIYSAYLCIFNDLWPGLMNIHTLYSWIFIKNMHSILTLE